MIKAYAKVNISKKLKAILKPGTPFVVETIDNSSDSGAILFELKDGIDPSVLAAIGASSISFEGIPDTVQQAESNIELPEPIPENVPSPVIDEADYVESMDLSGGAKPVSNFSGKKTTRVLADSKQKTPARAPKPASKPAPKPESNAIVDKAGFYEFLGGVKDDPSAIVQSEKRMTREQAISAETSGSIGSGKSMYIVNTADAQLVIDDLGIRLLRGAGYNLGSIPPAKLKASTHLFEAIENGLVKFVDQSIAAKGTMVANKRQERINDGDDSGVYDKADDVYDEIEGGADHNATNHAPSHLDAKDTIEINANDEYRTELDMISSDVERRESEIESSPPVENVPGTRIVERESR